MKAIEISHMTCDYGHGKGIFDISFTIDEGEVFGFLGPNVLVKQQRSVIYWDLFLPKKEIVLS